MWKKRLTKGILFGVLLLKSTNVNCQVIKETYMDSLKLNSSEELPSLHPHQLVYPIRGRCVAKVLFECLTRINDQGKAELSGAKSVNISPDQLRYTFVLRANKWSDGTPVTAFHYENAWKEALSPTSTAMRADLLYMIKNAEAVKRGDLPLEAVGIKATDAETLIVDLASPFQNF